MLKQELPWIDDIVQAKRPAKLPVVLTPQEVRAVLAKLRGPARLMANLLYGCGLRLSECVRLRVKDIDFGYLHITVRDAKGGRDRVTMLPVSLVESLRRQMERRRILHEEDLAAGYGTVFFPAAVTRKYPGAAHKFGWQYLFPSARRSADPAMTRILQRAGITLDVGPLWPFGAGGKIRNPNIENSKQLPNVPSVKSEKGRFRFSF